MRRIFEEHTKRHATCLDGAWKFLPDRDDSGEYERWSDGLHNAATVIVPSVWNYELGLMEYEGAAWYDTDIQLKTLIR